MRTKMLLISYTDAQDLHYGRSNHRGHDGVFSYSAAFFLEEDQCKGYAGGQIEY